MIAPQALLNLLVEADASDGPIIESALAGSMGSAVPQDALITDDERRGGFALTGGLNFQRPWGRPRSPWKIYWGEVATGVKDDGSVAYFPDVDDVEDHTIRTWIELADTLTHPVLVSRFADLAWEIGRHLKRERSADPSDGRQITTALDVSLARLAVDQNLRALATNLLADEHQSWQLIDRALGLASSVGYVNGVTGAKDALFTFHRLAAANGKYVWWMLDDISQRHSRALALSTEQEEEVMDSLRAALNSSVDIADRDRFNPHLATAAADRLARRRSQPGDPAEGLAARRMAGFAFERAADNVGGLVAIAWLEE